MKFFISHKKEDTNKAIEIAHALHNFNVDYYLDAFDSTISSNPKKLTDHIKNEMEKCSDIIVVISEKTKKSAWVYFEVGIAAHAQKATSTYMIDDTQLPEFLEYWPTLKNSNDLRAYISIKMEMYPSHKHLKNESYIGLKNTASSFHAPSLDNFYTAVKAQLKK